MVNRGIPALVAYNYLTGKAESLVLEIEGHGARWVMVGEDFRYGARRMGDVSRLREAGLACTVKDLAQTLTIEALARRRVAELHEGPAASPTALHISCEMWQSVPRPMSVLRRASSAKLVPARLPVRIVR